MYPEMMTLKEVCDYFRVEKRVLLRYGLEKIGGVRLGPRSWRFPRIEVMNHGVQKLQQQQGKVSVDRAADNQRQAPEKELSHKEGCSSLGISNPSRNGRNKDPFNLVAGLGD